MTDDPPHSLADLTRDVRCEYPVDRLAGCKTALVLFGAGFYGRSDGVWIARSGLTAAVVDVDAVRLDAMQRIYPDDWTFECNDVFDFAASALADDTRWDLLSIDPPIGLCPSAGTLLSTWADLARELIIVTELVGTDRIAVPDGWRMAECRQRSSKAAWLVLARDRDLRMGARLSEEARHA